MRVLLALLLLCIGGVIYLLAERSKEEDSLLLRHRTDELAAVQASLPDSLSLTPTFRKLSSPALEQRKATRRVFQRTGYANVLANVVRHDGVGALFSLVRMNAQVSYSLSHRPIEVYFPIVTPPDSVQRAGRVFSFHYSSSPFGVELYDDWTMPEDPWH